MDTYVAEQKTLLPLAEAPLRLAPARSSISTRQRELIESCALALIMFLAASQCLILYGVQNILYISPSSLICVFFTDLAVGLRLSIPAGLPTATLLFVASPYVARPERLLATWYMILLCYLAGSTLGALLLARI